MNKLYFLLGIHNHQPVGNFPEVLEDAFKKAYWPFINVLKSYPNIKWSLHCSGILWDFFEEKHQEYIALVKTMIESGQLELITGGYYEPILPVIPDSDKKGQIKKLTGYLSSTFAYQPKGIWLAERVWEPHLSKVLSESGVAYTLVDDTHFAAAGLDPAQLKGYYITEEQGAKLSIFPINKDMRYYIPFKTVHKTIEYFRVFAAGHPHPALVMGDDGEKFGMWPGTHKHVYEEHWLRDFFDALEKNKDWIETITFSEYMQKFPAEDRVYLPTASYFEMSEWSLPVKAQNEFEGVVSRFETQPQVKRFLKGGFWRNFLTKYPEANNMQKKMLHVSNKIWASIRARGAKTKKTDGSVPSSLAPALDLLYAGQCNCAYWHGVFGGLYLPHLRTAIYHNLIKAEALLQKTLKKPSWTIMDFDYDGKNEVLYESREQNLYFAPDKGGALFEWDVMKKAINLSNTLTRREESYHKKLRQYLLQKTSVHGAETVKTIHDLVSVKEGNLDKYLHYDWYPKMSLLDHFLHPGTQFEDFKKCTYGEQGDFVLGAYAMKQEKDSLILSRSGDVWLNDQKHSITLAKRITPLQTGYIVHYTITNNSASPLTLLFAPEYNFSFSYIRPEDESEHSRVTRWARKDEGFGFDLNLIFSNEATLWTFPVETVSLSESGFERTYQGTSVLPIFSLDLAVKKEARCSIEVRI